MPGEGRAVHGYPIRGSTMSYPSSRLQRLLQSAKVGLHPRSIDMANKTKNQLPRGRISMKMPLNKDRTYGTQYKDGAT